MWASLMIGETGIKGRAILPEAWEKSERQNLCAFDVQGSKATHSDTSKNFSRDHVA